MSETNGSWSYSAQAYQIKPSSFTATSLESSSRLRQSVRERFEGVINLPAYTRRVKCSETVKRPMLLLPASHAVLPCWRLLHMSIRRLILSGLFLWAVKIGFSPSHTFLS
jgi:hypothetical protein